MDRNDSRIRLQVYGEKSMIRFPHSLLGRTLLLVSGSILTFLAVLSILLYFGTGKILASWHENEAASLETYIKEKLTLLAISAEQTGMPITATDTARALDGLPFNPTWLVVTDPAGNPLYAWRDAGMGGMGKRNARMQGMRGMQLSQDLTGIQNWHQIKAQDGKEYFKYSAYIPDFGENESNRILINAARLILFWGFAIASLVSFVFALIFARPLKKQSAFLVGALDRMASGKRDVAYPSCHVTEFDHIARSSSILQKNLLREEDLRRQWAADIAHDIRTPLTVLHGQIEGMIDGVFAPDESRLARLDKEIRRLESLTNGLALLTRIETPGFIPSRRKIRIRAFLTEIADRYKEDAASMAGGDFIVESPDISVSADPELLERAVDNLVTNAIRYGVSGGKIRLLCEDPDASGSANAGTRGDTREGAGTGACTEAGGKKKIIVENEGTIDSAILPQLFDRMFRADNSRNTEGSGLGLSIAKAIVEAHEGKIYAECDAELNLTKFVIEIG